jgi:hypothetical protein
VFSEPEQEKPYQSRRQVIKDQVLYGLYSFIQGLLNV